MEKPIEQLLGLDPEEPVPTVNEESMRTAHKQVTKLLDTPLNAVYSEPESDEADVEYQVRVLRILPEEEHPVFGPYLGLLCEADVKGEQETIVVPLSRITNAKKDGNRKYIDAYNEWFWNFR